jgi:elongation of very long chain fatty acids protein 6
MPDSAYPPLIAQSIQPFESSFKGFYWVEFTRNHADIPIFCVSVYLFIIFMVPSWLPKAGFKMRKRFAFWNLCLSAFSIIGATRVVPVLYDALMTKGFKYTICEDPQNWYLDGPSGLWTTLFIYSKIPELLDTVYMVLQKPTKNILFLHWFHHLTVLLYCWHAFHHKIAPGLWFASMNFCVHAVMYLYYMMAIIGLKWVVAPFAQLITAIQITQMIVGMVVTASSAYIHGVEGDVTCSVNGPNYRMGLAMYSSYFLLFTKLFFDKYCTSKSGESPCDVSDKAGHFRNSAFSASTNNLAALNNKKDN